MDDKDHVFARFKDDKTAHSDRRETLTIPRRAGALGSRSVEVVHVRSGGAVRDRPQRQDQYVRAATWDGGFPTKQTPRASMPIEPTAPEAAEPVTHVMPAWEPAATEAHAAAAEEHAAVPRRGRGRPRKHPVSESAAATADAMRAKEAVVVSGLDLRRLRKQTASSTLPRHVADPFDTSDDGANCMRCGYAIERAREKRGLMTCSGCG